MSKVPSKPLVITIAAPPLTECGVVTATGMASARRITSARRHWESGGLSTPLALRERAFVFQFRTRPEI